MNTEFGWTWISLGLALGALIGSLITLWVIEARHAALRRDMDEEFKRKSDAVLSQVRVIHLRTQTELEQLRQAMQRQLATAGDEPRAAVALAESRLRAAYDEIYRLRYERSGDTTTRADLGDGFAATRPMVDQM